MIVSLVTPNESYLDSYKQLVKEFLEAGEKLVPFPLRYDFKDTIQFLALMKDHSTGKNVPKGFVANSTFWLVDQDSQVVGVSNLRHDLTEKLRIEGGHIGYGIRPSCRRMGYGMEILRPSLLEAKKLGISKVLVTCSKNNPGSAAIIIGNGGAFDSEEFVEEYGEIVQRYWISN